MGDPTTGEGPSRSGPVGAFALARVEALDKTVGGKPACLEAKGTAALLS